MISRLLPSIFFKAATYEVMIPDILSLKNVKLSSKSSLKLWKGSVLTIFSTWNTFDWFESNDELSMEVYKMEELFFGEGGSLNVLSAAILILSISSKSSRNE